MRVGMQMYMEAYTQLQLHHPAAQGGDPGWMGRGETPPLHDHELADVGQLLSAPLVKPLANGRPRQSCTVFQLATVRLGGDFSLPVLVADGAACHVDPLALCSHVVEAQPDLDL